MNHQQDVHVITLPTPYPVGDVNVFLLERGGSLTLIDAAADYDPCWDSFLRAVADRGLSLDRLSQILLTHSHPDHIGLVNRLTATRDIPVYAHREAIPRLKRDADYLNMRIRFYDELYREMGCGEAGERQVEKLRRDLTANRGQAIRSDILPLTESDSAGGMKVVEVPGHAPDQIAFWDADRQRLFAGDHLLQHISSNAFVEPDRAGQRIRSLVAYESSLLKILPLHAVRIYPGHGDVIENPEPLVQFRLRRMLQKAETLLDMIREGKTTASEIAQVYYRGKYETQFSPVMSEIIGLLDFMEEKGMVRSQVMDGIRHYRC